uniref:Uncharacterized protein n=1 Tax=Opuntia streptacantha TaxID=393608 RepID=A0A7C9DKC8_OPUST
MLKLLRFLHDLGFINMSELLQKFKRHVRGKLDEIWSLYLKEIEICHEPLANIIILDSCFLLGFLASGAKDIMFSAFRRDLALLENQVPFFVLVDFSFMISNHVASKIHLGLLILHTFKLCPTFHLSPGYLDSGENIYAKELGEDPYLSHVAKRVHDHVPDSIHLLDFIYRYHALQISARIEHNVPSKIPSSRAVRLRNATKLSASGVTIECAEFNHFHSVLNLSFSEGGLSIPPLLISDYTETLFINLLAHEHLSPNYRDYFTSYVFLMAQLIESEGDLQLLESFTMSLEVGGM